MVSIIVLVHNRPELTRQTLDSLHTTLSTTKVDHEVICVDNNSDLSTQKILEKFEFHHFIRLPQNTGVGRGKNAGVAKAKGDYLYISDNDIYFYPKWLDTLVKAAQVFPEAKIIGAFRHPNHGCPAPIERKDMVFEPSDQQVGSSWFLSRQTWEKFGPLLEDVPVGSDDVHFCNQVTASGALVGSIHPYKVFHCGLHNTSGEWSPGGELRSKQPLPPGILVK